MPSRLSHLPDRGDFVRRRLLLGHEMVETEHHQRVGVREDALVDRLLEPGLVDALKHGHRMPGHLADGLLESEGRSVEQLERPGDPLQELRRGPLRRLDSSARPRGAPRSWSRTGCPFRSRRGWTPRDSSRSSRC